MKKLKWYDLLIYRLFYWKWKPILAARPDLRELAIAYLKAYDALDDGENIKVTVTIEKNDL